MKKVLKNLEPSIRAYLGDAFCFSIINDYAFDSGWVYDKYIHLEYTPFDGQIKYADYDYYDFVPDQGVFIKSFIEYPYTYCNQELICHQIMQMIDNDEYCFALWDETIVTNYLFQQSEKAVYEHGCMVHGYDRDEKMFYTQGYLSNEKWEHYSIPFDVFYKAISYCPEKGEIALVGYKVRDDYEWKFAYKKMKKELQLYVKRGLSPEIKDRYDSNAIVNFFSNLIFGKKIHYPSVYCIYEHKVIFAKRIQYLIQQGYMEKSSVVELAAELEKVCRKILLLVIRYNSSLEQEIFGVLYMEVKKMLDMEKELLSQCNFFAGSIVL